MVTNHDVALWAAKNIGHELSVFRGRSERLNVLFRLRRLIHILGGKIWDRGRRVVGWCLWLRGIERYRGAARMHPLHRAQHRHDNEHDQSCDAMPRTELVNGASGKPQKVLLSGHDGLRV